MYTTIIHAQPEGRKLPKLQTPKKEDKKLCATLNVEIYVVLFESGPGNVDERSGA